MVSRIKSKQMTIDDQPCSGRSSIVLTNENFEKIREIILEDRRRSIDEVIEKSRVTWNSVRLILSGDLGTIRVVTAFVSRLLIAQQKQSRLKECFNGKIPK